VQLEAKELLAGMANLAGGTYRAFDATQRINLFYIDFTSFMRTFALKQLVAMNLNALSVGGETVVDTDGDGLSDAEEELAGTSSATADTDGDGFSDLLEVRQSNAGFDPLFSGDADCRMATDRLDDDGDGLLNCEERYFGTNSRLIDSDGDGFPDDVEVRMGTNPAAADTLYDSDFDGARNGIELQAHTDPLRNDVADFSRIAYRYNIELLRDDQSPARTSLLRVLGQQHHPGSHGHGHGTARGNQHRAFPGGLGPRRFSRGFRQPPGRVCAAPLPARPRGQDAGVGTDGDSHDGIQEGVRSHAERGGVRCESRLRGSLVSRWH
jgi:hypothetical protein